MSSKSNCQQLVGQLKDNVLPCRFLQKRVRQLVPRRKQVMKRRAVLAAAWPWLARMHHLLVSSPLFPAAVLTLICLYRSHCLQCTRRTDVRIAPRLGISHMNSADLCSAGKTCGRFWSFTKPGAAPHSVV